MSASYVDRGDNLWRVTGHTPEGIELLACDNPQDPDDRGEGESFPWTRRSVESWFGPLTAVTPDAEQAELAAVDATLHEVFGRDETAWTEGQTQRYLAGIDVVHARFETHRSAA